MDEEYKKKFRENWYKLMRILKQNHNLITLTDAYHIVKMCSKCDMTFDDFSMWGIEDIQWDIEEIK